MALEHFSSILLLCKRFLRSSIYKDATFVLLWKLLSKIPGDRPNGGIEESDCLIEISKVLMLYVYENIEQEKIVTQSNNEKFQRRKKNFVKYAKFLSSVLKQYE